MMKITKTLRDHRSFNRLKRIKGFRSHIIRRTGPIAKVAWDIMMSLT